MNPQTQRAVRQLIAALEAELGHAHRILVLLREQSRALLAADVVRVAEIEREVRDVMRKRQVTERERAEAAILVTRCLQMGSETAQTIAPLTAVARRLAGPEAARLLSVRARLIGLHSDIAATTAANRPMIEMALQFIQVSLEAVARAVARPAGYGPRRVGAPNLLIDQRV